MRLGLVALLILLFIVAPVYLVSHLIRSDSDEDLVAGVARDIVAEMPQLPGVESIAVAPLEGDVHKALKFALVDELRRAGKYQIIEAGLISRDRLSARKLIRELRGEYEQEIPKGVEASAIFTGRIQRNEVSGPNRLLHFQAVLVDAVTGEVLWTGSSRPSLRMSGQEWEFRKVVLLICLAFAAGILVIYARLEDQKRFR